MALPLLLPAFALIASGAVHGAPSDDMLSPGKIKRMSLEELMEIEVSLVSRGPEKLIGTASAVQVITRDEIRRSGAATLPQALRLASNLHVAQVDAREWAISARGFNNTAANKLLVMIDGRTVYTPLYSGVFWDAQHVLLEDVDRIEVVSGPGGTLWGSNAVNGVINIVTAPAEATQGAYISAGAGTYLRDFIQGRYGGKIGETLYYRAYSQHSDHDGVLRPDGTDDGNESEMSQGGFRLDWRRRPEETLTLQGDVYDGLYGIRDFIGTSVSGFNVLGRWNRAFSPDRDLRVQAYFDRAERKSNLGPASAFSDDTRTLDIEGQFRIALPLRQSLLLGTGYRYIWNEVENFAPLAFLPERKELRRFNGFVQDEISLLPDRLKLILGTKVEHEEFEGWNLQPSVRGAWTPDSRQTLWGAISRAVRTPSRIDVEFYAPRPPVDPAVLKFAGSPDFSSERLTAYEMGYRIQALDIVSLSLAAFYNRYDDLRSLELPDPSTLTVEFLNGLEGETRGVELSGVIQPTRWWRTRLGYTWVEKDLWEKPGHVDHTSPRGEWNDPEHRFSAQADIDLPSGFRVYLAGGYVSRLPGPAMAPQYSYDAGLAWRHGPFEASVYGRNLDDDQDPEFRIKDREGREIPRSFHGRLAWRL